MRGSLRYWFALPLVAGSILLGCSQSVDSTSTDDATITATHEASITGQEGSFRLTINDQALFAIRNGKRVLVIQATANRNLSDVFSWVPDDAFGTAKLLSARKFEVVLSDDHELNSVLSGMPLFVRITPAASNAKTIHARVQLAPRFTQFAGDSTIWISDSIRPIYVRNDAANPLRYRGKVLTSTSASQMTAQCDGNNEPSFARIDSRTFRFDWLFANLVNAGDSPKDKVDFRAKLSSGANKSKRASIAMTVTQLDLTGDDPYVVWPTLSCPDAVAQCIRSTPADAADYAACGDYRAVSTCLASVPQTGEVSALFPPTSQYVRPLEMAWIPADADRGDIEEDAHVVDYRTADRKHSCELWWMGGDGGTPILSYLVDETGAHYLPELSQPQLEADRPFESVEAAKQTFIRLAEAHYAAADAARAHFDAARFENFGSVGLPGGSRIDARPGNAARASIPGQVLEAFDFYYRVEVADWGSTSLHQGTLGGHDVYAVFTSTDGDDAWLEVFSKSGTPLVSARIWAGQILGWDEFFGRTRLSTGLESLWNAAVTEGYSEPAERAAAGQIPLDWAPTLTLDNGTLSHASNRLTTVELTTATALSSGQRQLAVAAFEILWNRTLQYRTTGTQALTLPNQGSLRIGTFVNPVDRKSYYVADWRDIDDASYTFYFVRSGNMFVPAILQYNN